MCLINAQAYPTYSMNKTILETAIFSVLRTQEKGCVVLGPLQKLSIDLSLPLCKYSLFLQFCKIYPQCIYPAGAKVVLALLVWTSD